VVAVGEGKTKGSKAKCVCVCVQGTVSAEGVVCVVGKKSQKVCAHDTVSFPRWGNAVNLVVASRQNATVQTGRRNGCTRCV